MRSKDNKKGEEILSPRSKQVGAIKTKGDKLGTIGSGSPKVMVSPRRPKQKNEELVKVKSADKKL